MLREHDEVSTRPRDSPGFLGLHGCPEEIGKHSLRFPMSCGSILLVPSRMQTQNSNQTNRESSAGKCRQHDSQGTL